ncbi:MAG: PD-(D/E)XK nuclease family protein [Brevinemataceae bacterium]
MNKPNIFNYATSELSQDALICYFAEWANPKYQDNGMYTVGQNFVKSLLAKHNINIDITEVQVYRQYQNIDVLLIVNNQYALIIEDKTTSSEHSEQLKRYQDLVENDKKFEGLKVLGIYFKTANQSYLKNINDSNYKLYLRNDILEFINSSPKTEDTIFNNFTQKIQEIEDSINSWKELPIKEWDWYSWIGFYDSLPSLLGEETWYGYVPNQSGGSLSSSWGWNDWNNFEVALQCDAKWDSNQERYVSTILFKIAVTDKVGEDEDTREYRNNFHHLLTNHADQFDIQSIRKPDRFGYGKTMTCCAIDEQYWIGDVDSDIDIDRVVERLQNYKKLLNECCEK